MSLWIDLTGRRFGRLRVVSFSGDRYWKCKCRCGAETIVQRNHLQSGHTKSCGCLRREQPPGYKHGFTGTPEYQAWIDMIKRCTNQNHRAWKDYGGRGIKICLSWRLSFLNFYKDLGPRPRGLTLDRKNNDGNYEPKNCRWTTQAMQQSNKRKIKRK